MEEMRRILNEYVGHAAGIVTQVKHDVGKVAQAGEQKQEELTGLLKDKKWEKAAKMIDGLVGNKI